MIRFTVAPLLALTAFAETTASFNPRVSANAYIREDLFSGFLANDMVRFAQSEKTIEALLPQRPAERSSLLAWKGSAAFYRAVLAHEKGDSAEFQRLYTTALALFSEAGAARRNDGDIALAAICGASNLLFAERLPEQYRAAAWTTAYNGYHTMWEQQKTMVDKLPVHIKGELLAGLAQSAQRTGKTTEMNEHLDRMMTMLAGTPYEMNTKKWKADPASAGKVKIACMSCHDDGRLKPSLARVAARK